MQLEFATCPGSRSSLPSRAVFASLGPHEHSRRTRSGKSPVVWHLAICDCELCFFLTGLAETKVTVTSRGASSPLIKDLCILQADSGRPGIAGPCIRSFMIACMFVRNCRGKWSIQPRLRGHGSDRFGPQYSFQRAVGSSCLSILVSCSCMVSCGQTTVVHI
jgi:hypothetical protein